MGYGLKFKDGTDINFSKNATGRSIYERPQNADNM
jgi:hypothetical protein